MLRQTKILLVLGTLGSGKTTLVKHLLAHSQSRIAFLQNEFSEEMGIEAPLIRDCAGKPFERMVELPNGCLCCAATGDTVLAVQALLQSYPDIEYLVVQANGLADPVKSVQLFWLDEGKRIPAQLHSVVSLLRGKLDKAFESAIALSDIVLVNFADQLQPAQQEAIRQQAKQINADCEVLTCEFGQVEFKRLVDRPAFQVGRLARIGGGLQGHPHLSYSHVLLSNLRTGRESVERGLEQLLWESHSFEVVRVKGIFRWEEKVYSVQGVGQQFQIREEEETGQQFQNRLLLIGRGIKEGSMMKFFS